MNAQPEKVVAHYTRAYQQLYNRDPKDLHLLDNEWVVVNGAKMRLVELEYLTKQLQLEYDQGKEERRSVLKRLITWLKG